MVKICSESFHASSDGSNFDMTVPDLPPVILPVQNVCPQHSTALESYLIKPIQRILKYPLLLTQLKVGHNQHWLLSLKKESKELFRRGS